MLISSEECRKQFLILRRKNKRKIEKADFLERDDITIDCFNDVCMLAADNDPIAQDYLSYIHKKGLGDIIPENYEKYMQFQILAGANGNCFAIDKLALFLNYAFNEIMFAEDFEFIVERNDLTQENYQYVVGKLLCEAMADELELNPAKLVVEELKNVEFNAKLMRGFDRARNFAIPKVLKFLRS